MTQDDRELSRDAAETGSALGPDVFDEGNSPGDGAGSDDRWEKLRAGDEAERVALYERHHDELVSWFRVKLPVRSEAEDCVSEVFVRAFDGIARGLEPRESVDQWLWGIARHVWMGQLKARKRSTDQSLDDVRFEVEGGDAASVGSGAPEPAPGHVLGKRQAFAALYTAADFLSPTQRTAVGAYLDRSLAEMREVKGAELAEHLGWPSHKVHVELSRAMPKVFQRVGLLAAARSMRSCPERKIPALAGMLADGRSGADLVPTAEEFAALAKHAPQCVHCRSVVDSAVSETQWALGPGLVVLAAWQISEDDEERRRAAVAWWSGRTPTPAGGTPPVPPVPALAEAVAGPVATAASGASGAGPLTRVFQSVVNAVVRPAAGAARTAREATVNQLLRIPGVTPAAMTANRIAAENPVAVRVGGVAVALAAATAVTIAAVTPGSSSSAQPTPPGAMAPATPGTAAPSGTPTEGPAGSADPTPGTPTGEPGGGASEGPTGAPGEGGAPPTDGPTGGGDPLGGRDGSSGGSSGGTSGGTNGGTNTPSGTGGTNGTGTGGQVPGGSTGGGTTTPPAPSTGAGPAVWGFWMVRFADDPIGTTRELAPSDLHPVNHEGNWTYGVWRMGNPPVIKQPRVTHTAVGRHTVVLPDTGAPGGVAHVAVSDYAANGVSCQPVAWWQQGADEAIDVACFDRSGAPADVPFTGLFVGGAQNGPNSAGGTRGYVYASAPSAARQTPSAAYSQGTGAVTRTGAGRYEVAVAPGTTRVQVSAVGTAPRHCAITGLSGGTASVACTTHGGAAADTAFALSHTGAQSLLDDRRVPHGVSMTVTDSPGAPAPVVGDTWMSRPGTASVTRTAVGRYTLRFNVGYLTSYTHLTATGSGYCSWVIRNDYSRKDDVVLYVACYNASGAAVNSGFQLTYMTASPHYP